ncbi:MAG TPA: hypothetical protein VF506_14920 [Streptosporangiaceae bacterium]
MGLFSSKPSARNPSPETRAALDKWTKADKDYDRAVKSGDQREISRASSQLMSAQRNYEQTSHRNGDRW